MLRDVSRDHVVYLQRDHDVGTAKVSRCLVVPHLVDHHDITCARCVGCGLLVFCYCEVFHMN